MEGQVLSECMVLGFPAAQGTLPQYSSNQYNGLAVNRHTQLHLSLNPNTSNTRPFCAQPSPVVVHKYPSKLALAMRLARRHVSEMKSPSEHVVQPSTLVDLTCNEEPSPSNGSEKPAVKQPLITHCTDSNHSMEHSKQSSTVEYLRVPVNEHGTADTGTVKHKRNIGKKSGPSKTQRQVVQSKSVVKTPVLVPKAPPRAQGIPPELAMLLLQLSSGVTVQPLGRESTKVNKTRLSDKRSKRAVQQDKNTPRLKGPVNSTKNQSKRVSKVSKGTQCTAPIVEHSNTVKQQSALLEGTSASSHNQQSTLSQPPHSLDLCDPLLRKSPKTSISPDKTIALLGRLEELEAEANMIRDKWQTVTYDVPSLPTMCAQANNVDPSQSTCTLSPERLASIAKYSSEYAKHLQLTGTLTQGGFDPWEMAERIADTLLMEAVDNVMTELDTVCSSYIDSLYTGEFRPPTN